MLAEPYGPTYPTLANDRGHKTHLAWVLDGSSIRDTAENDAHRNRNIIERHTNGAQNFYPRENRIS